MRIYHFHLFGRFELKNYDFENMIEIPITLYFSLIGHLLANAPHSR
jgi:hypothetical protein